MKPSYREPVEVHCIVRPLDDVLADSCLTVLSDTVVQVVPPEASQATKATQYTFTGVFDEKSSQKKIFDTVVLPLIEDLLHGKNSLLFAYGVTGSGKTHTMNGELQDGGIIPRCLDVIFNSIGHFQAKKYIFKPDKMNSFEIQSEINALDQTAEVLTSNHLKTRGTDATRISALDQDQAFAVFVTFVVIYNNTVFDLLDDTPIDRGKTPSPSKILREDRHRNMYVQDVTEIEVKSADEAAEVLAKGQKRRPILNAESSRSHSVFNIRVVQAPLNYQGAAPEKMLTVSQLSLVDLAGSERNNRSERLREAGTRKTLWTLRSCMEILRENQLNSTNKLVPYRDSKITHLFKSYFDGEGKVRMIVCVNTRADEYDETCFAMRFAETAQEVQIARAVQPNIRLDTTCRATPVGREAPMKFPGRRKANRVLTEAYRILEQGGIRNPQSLIPFEVLLVYSAASMSNLNLELESDERLLQVVLAYLKQIIQEKRNHEEARLLIHELEVSINVRDQELVMLKEELKQEREEFESRVLDFELVNAKLKRCLKQVQAQVQQQAIQELLDDSSETEFHTPESAATNRVPSDSAVEMATNAEKNV